MYTVVVKVSPAFRAETPTPSSGFPSEDFFLAVDPLLKGVREKLNGRYETSDRIAGPLHADGRGTLWLLVHTYNALLARIESLDFAVFGERVRLSKAEKMIFIARAKFGRHTRDNVLEKRDRDWRRAGGAGGRRRAG